MSTFPEDNYILRVSDAEDAAEDSGSSDRKMRTDGTPDGATYLNKEISIHVQSDMNDVDVPDGQGRGEAVVAGCAEKQRSDANREMKYPAGAKARVPFGTTEVMP